MVISAESSAGIPVSGISPAGFSGCDGIRIMLYGPPVAGNSTPQALREQFVNFPFTTFSAFPAIATNRIP
ncbi:hypothetical protein NBRGN_012_00080 [Nocardia brasiliensis NBRC 14402]|nr:hypothetical protein NBRGN_012_00080 [Nocardia brasiliensis NBRC 14402]